MVPARSTFKTPDDGLEPGVLQKVVRRDGPAMAVFFEYYYDRVYAHVAQLTRDRTSAEDLTQEIFIRLQKTIERLDPDRDPTGWVFTLATNVVRDHWRSAGQRRRQAEVSDETAGAHLLPHPDPDVAAVLEKDEELRAVWGALAEVSPEDREIILLRDFEELPTADIATMLELNNDAVRQRHSRAVARLSRAFLKARTGEGGGS
jgi:RNA polymerase sigma-70 factor (ECF subfamily)